MFKKITQTRLLTIFFSLFALNGSALATCDLSDSNNLIHRNLNIVGAEALSAAGQIAYTAATGIVLTPVDPPVDPVDPVDPPVGPGDPEPPVEPPVEPPTVDIATACANGDEFQFAGDGYECAAPVSGRVWLDRNLGAEAKCTTREQVNCRGDYYQWGRNTDGHEQSDSGTSDTKIPYLTTDNANFITGTRWASDDDGGALRINRWAATNGSGICPIGFRVPTIAELSVVLSGNIFSGGGGGNSWSLAGFRDSNNGALSVPTGFNANGNYWSTNVAGAGQSLYWNIASFFSQQNSRFNAVGHPVRCIQDNS